LNVIVCVKQVPDPERAADVQIDKETYTLKREGIQAVINPFDMFAIEEGLRIKERYGGKVTAISMGPLQAEQALRETLSLGVDEAVLVSSRAFAGSDTLATSYALAKGIQKIGDYDIIICGKQASDGDTAQVGPWISENLGLSFLAWVRKIEHIEDGIMRAQRLMEDGYDVVDLPIPALITVVKEINVPRLPSLKGKMRAKRAEITVWNEQDIGADISKIGLDGSPTKVIKIFTPERKGRGEIIQPDNPDEAASFLSEKFREMNLI
jgi:electron transfer flavoprotein beta subunit